LEKERTDSRDNGIKGVHSEKFGKEGTPGNVKRLEEEGRVETKGK